MNPNMTPIPIPPEAAATRPDCRALRIGPPPGVSDADCGTLESLVGKSPEGYPMYAGYWRPDAEQLEALAAGGFIELIQYAPRMVMHSMTVWSIPTPPATDTCGSTWEYDVDFAVGCQRPFEHDGPCSGVVEGNGGVTMAFTWQAGR